MIRGIWNALFSTYSQTLKWVRSSGYFWWTSEARDNPTCANFGKRNWWRPLPPPSHLRVSILDASVCTFKTSPCMPTPRANTNQPTNTSTHAATSQQQHRGREEGGEKRSREMNRDGDEERDKWREIRMRREKREWERESERHFVLHITILIAAYYKNHLHITYKWVFFDPLISQNVFTWR